MSAAKHTPGPWIVHKSNMMTIEDTNKQSIAMPLHPWSAENDAEFEANARLIAAAPELLEALRDMVSDHVNLSPATLEIAKAAIAKATGKEAP